MLPSARVSLVLPIALLAVSSGCWLADVAVPLFDRRVQLIVEHIDEKPLDAETRNGTVTATAFDGEVVEITALLRSPSQERLDAAELRAVRDQEGGLRISVEWPEGEPRSREQCHLGIRLPNAENVRFTSRNGSVNVSGLAGTAELESTNGEIRVVDHAGPVSARTTNGPIKIASSAEGDVVVAHTSNGAIEIDSAPAGVDATSSNGPIDIRLAAAGSGPVIASTSNGRLSLTLGAAFVGSLEVSNSNGELEIDERLSDRVVSREKRRAELAFGSADARSSVSTTNGGISVRLEEGAEGAVDDDLPVVDVLEADSQEPESSESNASESDPPGGAI